MMTLTSFLSVINAVSFSEKTRSHFCTGRRFDNMSLLVSVKAEGGSLPGPRNVTLCGYAPERCQEGALLPLDPHGLRPGCDRGW